MPKKYKAWSEKESTVLRLNAVNYTIPEIAEMMKRHPSLIYKKVDELGLRDIVKRERKGTKQRIPPRNDRSCKWREHPVYEGYWVSDTGRVWSARRGRELTRVKCNGRYVVMLMKGKTKNIEYIGRMVIDAWLRPKHKYMIYYRDKNPLNNDLANLLPASISTVRGLVNHKPVMLIKNNKIIKVYRSIKAAADEHGIQYKTMCNQLHKKVKRTRHGLDFRFYVKPKREEDDDE